MRESVARTLLALFAAVGSLVAADLTYVVHAPPAMVNWEAAQAYCVSLNGTLPVILSEAENEAAASVLGVNPRAFIGLSDVAEEGNFVWVDGSPVTYTNWLDGEPDDANTGDCVSFWNSKQWADHGCGNIMNVVLCQFGARPTSAPSAAPTISPSHSPTISPTPFTSAPSISPSKSPTRSPSRSPTRRTSIAASSSPTTWISFLASIWIVALL